MASQTPATPPRPAQTVSLKTSDASARTAATQVDDQPQATTTQSPRKPIFTDYASI